MTDETNQDHVEADTSGEENDNIQPQSALDILATHGINCGVQSFMDLGGQWTCWIGDPMHGRAAEQDGLPTLKACEEWLSGKALELYPHIAGTDLT